MDKKDKAFNGLHLVAIASALLVVAHLVAKLYFKTELVDPIVIGLLFLSLAPWIVKVISRAELPGGWVIEFRQLKEEQEKQKGDIEAINTFLINNFLSEDELNHLRKIDGQQDFLVKKDATSRFFENELRKLRSLKLIEGQPGKGIRTLLQEDGSYQNVKDHFAITRKGKDFLNFLKDTGT